MHTFHLCSLQRFEGNGWSRLHHACYADLQHRVRALLLEGGEDEHSVTRTTPGSASTFTALSLCPEGGSRALMSQAILPWSPERHSMYPTSCRAQVRWLMLLHHRLSTIERIDRPDAPDRPVKRRRTEDCVMRVHGVFPLALPRALWYGVLEFLVRRFDGNLLCALGFK